VLTALRHLLHVVGNDFAADEAPRLRLGRLLRGRIATVPVSEDERSRSELRQRCGVTLHIGLERFLERFEAILVPVLAVADDGVAYAVANLEQVDRTLTHAAARDRHLRDQRARVSEQSSLKSVRLRWDRVDSA